MKGKGKEVGGNNFCSDCPFLKRREDSASKREGTGNDWVARSKSVEEKVILWARNCNMAH